MNLVNVKPGFVRTSQMDKFFDDFFQANREVKPASYRPAANIINQEKAYVIELLIPGIDKKELNIALEKDILTIKANREETNGED
ncbi:MAG: Hsp20 family protein, partial [Saprospiraceae bacterium]|nr:Hsp20 family protein [Saprospiraceae bacterium]